MSNIKSKQTLDSYIISIAGSHPDPSLLQALKSQIKSITID